MIELTVPPLIKLVWIIFGLIIIGVLFFMQEQRDYDKQREKKRDKQRWNKKARQWRDKKW